MSGLSPKHWIIGIVAISLLAYAGFQGRFIILGPQVEITSHYDGEVVDNSVIILEGRAKNISRIDLNGRQIFTDEDGFWSEDVVLAPGMSTMTVTVRSRTKQENEKEKSIRIIFNRNDQE